jgi:hypothetical protein
VGREERGQFVIGDGIFGGGGVVEQAGDRAG